MRVRFGIVLCLVIFSKQPLDGQSARPSATVTEQQTKAAIAALADPNCKEAVGLWNTLGTIHQTETKLGEAEQDYRRALAANTASSAPSPQMEASVLNNLATIQQARRDFSGAGILLKQGYDLLQKQDLTQSAFAAPLVSNLALNLHQLGQLAQAEQAYREAETIFSKNFKNDTADFVLLLSNFGLLRFETGHYEEGLLLERRALEIQAKLPITSVDQRAYVLNNLGYGLAAAGQFPEAHKFLLECVEYAKSGSSVTSYRLIEILSNLATVEEKMGNYAQARKAEEDAEKLAWSSLSENDPLWATIWNNLGLISFMQGDRGGARRQYDKSAALWLRTLGPTNPHYAATLSNIASLERASGHYKQAEGLAARVLQIDAAFFGSEHPRVAEDLENLAAEVFCRKRVDEAIALLLRARVIEEKSLGKDSLALAPVFDNLASAYQKTKRFDEAKDAYRQAIRCYEAQPNPPLASLALSLHQYAALLRQLGDFAGAEMAEVRATRADVKGVLAAKSASHHEAAAGFR